MIATIGSVFPVFALILIGWGAGRRGLFAPSAVPVLNGFVVQLALPVLLFQFVAEADWHVVWQPGFLAAMLGGIVVTFALGFVVAGRGAVAEASVAERSIGALAAAYANTAFIGIPIGQALFGTVGLAAAVIASLLTVCLSFAFAILLVEIDLHRGNGLRGGAAAVGRSLARNPLVIGPAAGALWAASGFMLPDPLHWLAALLGAAASPVALVTIGLFLAAAPPARTNAGALPLVMLKLIVQPLVTAALVLLLHVPGRWGAAAILIAALPTGTGPFMLATLYARDAAVPARVILITTIVAAFSVSLLAVLLV